MTAASTTPTPRRGKAMPTDGPTPRFLYTILKQLDLRTIDWNLVATQLEISNGHAARMRYARFKQQMEGNTPQARGNRPKKTPAKGKKGLSSKEELFKDPEVPQPQQQPFVTVKHEPGMPMSMPMPTSMSPYDPSISNQSPYIKSEPYINDEPYAPRLPHLAEIPHFSSQMMVSGPGQMMTGPYGQTGAIFAPDMGAYAYASPYRAPTPMGLEPYSTVHGGWSPVKTEPEERGVVDEIAVKVEPKDEADDEVEVEFQGMNVVKGDGCAEDYHM